MILHVQVCIKHIVCFQLGGRRRASVAAFPRKLSMLGAGSSNAAPDHPMVNTSTLNKLCILISNIPHQIHISLILLHCKAAIAIQRCSQFSFETR